MDDERRQRQAEFQHHAKNPTENMTVYRMQNGPGESLGVHWTTDPNVAHYTGLGNGPGEQLVHRGVVNPDQIISQGEWMGGNIRSHYTENGQFKTAKSQWGFDSEAEVRLRPGSTVREHAVAPQGSQEYTPSGREPTIEERGRDGSYVDLAHHAVQGTPEARRLHEEQGKLPHKQMSMLEPILDRKSGREIGYVPELDHYPGDFHEALDARTADGDKVAKAAGVESLYDGGWYGGAAHEPLLQELRHTPVSQPEPTHRRVANQMQFDGF